MLSPAKSDRTPTAFLAIFALGIGTALSLMGDNTLYTVLPTHYADAGIALASVGVILSVNRVIRLVTNGPAGWLYDRMRDHRIIFIASLIIGIISTTLYALSENFTLFLLARLLWGAAWSGIWVGGNAIVLEMAPESERGRWVGIYQVWFFFGSSLGAFLGGVLTDTYGYRNALWLGAIISTLGAIIATLGLMRDNHAAQRPVILKPQAAFSLDLRTLSMPLWAVIAAHGVNRLVVAGVITSTLGLLIQNLRGDALGVASITGGLLAARTVISLGSAGIFGEWSDRRGSRWGLLIVSLILGSIGMIVFAITDWVALLIGALIGAIASGSIQSLATALVGDLSSNTTRGRNLGIFNTAGDLGSAIGPVAAYALYPSTGLGVVFIACALLILANAIWIMSLRVAQRRNNPEI